MFFFVFVCLFFCSLCLFSLCARILPKVSYCMIKAGPFFYFVTDANRTWSIDQWLIKDSSMVWMNKRPFQRYWLCVFSNKTKNGGKHLLCFEANIQIVNRLKVANIYVQTIFLLSYSSQIDWLYGMIKPACLPDWLTVWVNRFDMDAHAHCAYSHVYGQPIHVVHTHMCTECVRDRRSSCAKCAFVRRY